jgi:hypothetical protein
VPAGQELLQSELLCDPANEKGLTEGHDLQEAPFPSKLSLFKYLLAGQLQSDTLVDPADEVAP